MGNLPFVDGLRAVAIAAVVIYHAFPAAMPGGFAGVDVFFVISGFLITRIIAVEIANGSFSLGTFFLRRARRLLPAALVCFAAVSAVAWFVLLPDAYLYFGRSLLSSVLMYANYFFYNTGGYFSAPALEKPLLHTWSLAVEDQFYVTWPLILLALQPRVTRRVLIGGALLLVALSLWFAQMKVTTDPELAFFWLPARAWELLTGAVLALGMPHIRMSRTAAELFSTAGMSAVLASFWALSPESNFPGLAAVPACLGTALVIAAGVTHETRIKHVLSLKPVVFVGLISYSLYLWHWPLISLSSYRLERPLEAIEALAIVAASFVIAVISWRFVEKPFRIPHRAERVAAGPRSDRNFIFGAVAGVVFLAGLAGLLKVWKGVPQRFEPEVAVLLKQLVAGNSLRGACDNYDKIFANDEVCNFGRKKQPSDSYEIALFGDSMADQWTPLVAKFSDANNLAGRQVTNGGCALLFGVTIPAWPAAKAAECLSYQIEAERFISANPGLKVVVISAYWEKWLRRFEMSSIGGPQRNEDVLPDIPGIETPAFDRVISDTVRVFTDRGIKVVLIGQIPTYVAVPVRCIVGAVRDRRDSGACGKSVADATRELGASNRALTRIAVENPKVSVSLPIGYMCNGTQCPPLLDGVLLYKNGQHINRFGALQLSRFVPFPLP